MSVTITGIFISFLGFLVSKFSLPFTSEEVEHFGAIVLQLVGLAIAWWGRYRNGGITPLGLKK